MKNNCYTGVEVPNLITEPCEGCYSSDLCTIHENSIPYLELPVNSSVKSIIDKMVLALKQKDIQILELSESIYDTQPKYRVFTALLSLSGVNPPTAIILENTLGQIPTFSYNVVGNYSINVIGSIFTNNKTFVSITAPTTDEDVVLKASSISVNSVRISRSVLGIPTDGSDINISIEIRVYN